MIWRTRKVLRDRAAGMVFDWRRGHGSTYRLIVAGILAAAFWGALLAYVRIGEAEPIAAVDDQIDLTMVNLDAESNRWLAEAIERETLFQERWEVRDSAALDREVMRALLANSPRDYEPTLREIPRPEPELTLQHLPSRGPDELPEPEPVEVLPAALPVANWWMEVEVVDGPEDLEKFDFPFAWPDQPKLMSEGERWPIMVTVDWRGRVVALEAWWEKAGDARTQAILERVRAHSFPVLETSGPLRTWRLEAEVVNRPLEASSQK